MTHLTGQTPESDSATVDQELAFDQRYWGDHYNIHFPIGVQKLVPAYRINGDAPMFDSYYVAEAPTYFVIDRHGIVRYVQWNHTPDLEARLTAVVEQLLHES
jgi:peroxiredoxin